MSGFLNWLDPCGLCYHCAHCGRPSCRDNEPSPTEDQRICGACAHLADGLRGWGGGDDVA